MNRRHLLQNAASQDASPGSGAVALSGIDGALRGVLQIMRQQTSTPIAIGAAVGR
ncbi:MAG: hypothetical protein ABI693_03715 [Bryobacteraceae bacterium]